MCGVRSQCRAMRWLMNCRRDGLTQTFAGDVFGGLSFPQGRVVTHQSVAQSPCVVE
jgi:hypothetical protein